ncbi:signal transduction histidine kinase [Larkinella arboricola]|uniref:histidine kinase n=1 Tax=Larkinella arboricola TaxID=643671 RepID=A0A327WNR5_LARAB|nr:sensor histidine kinase [Larkinella arboricola]RAJ93164.1 signal transduction histidine kinase [Larkinella arboricola]
MCIDNQQITRGRWKKPSPVRGFWLALGWLLSVTLAWGQTGPADEIVPPARFYSPDQYNAHSQNFAVTQDQRRVLYMGNFAGVLEYDGLDWRTIPTATISKVSSLLRAENGNICVGGNGEFGYLRPDPTGKLQFVSLSQNVKGRFNEIIAILEAPDGIYFIARNALFRWDGTVVTEWNTTLNILSAFQSNQQIYVFQQRKGLSILRSGTLVPVNRSSQVPVLYDAVALLPLGSGESLLVTSNQGGFRLVNNTVEPFENPLNTYLSVNQATCGTRLPDQSLAISTLRGGIVLMTPDGQLKQIVRGIAGVTDQMTNAMFPDREGNLWLALNNGIAQLEIPSQLSFFSGSARQMGEVMDIKRVGEVVYLATVNGLFRIEQSEVRPVPGLSVSCFALADVGGTLYVATSKGVFRVKNGEKKAITQEYTLSLKGSRRDPSRLYAGTENGLRVLTVSDNPRAASSFFMELDERIFGLEEDPQGNIWLETLTRGLHQFRPATNQVSQYTNLQGLPTLLYNRLATTSLGLLVCNEKGIFRYDPQQDRFEAFNPFNDGRPAADHWHNALLEDPRGNFWTVGGDKKKVVFYQKQRNGFRAESTPFLPVSTSPINVIYPDRNGIVWMGGRDGLIRYDARVSKRYDQPYDALIRQIRTGENTVLFNGFEGASESSAGPNKAQTALPYQGNSISFEFSAASYPTAKGLQFQYKLENFDKNWSDWTAENWKEYTNLPAGTYQFRVKARTIYQLPSREATYSFTVLPPWYGRWWVIGLLVIGAGVLLVALVRWRLAAVVREKQALETLIQERTEEVVHQKSELEKQSEELAIKNDQLEKIDLFVQSINAEIDFANLFQTVLAKFSVIRNMNGASFLLYDKSTGTFRYKALKGSHDLSHVESVQLSPEQAEQRFLSQAVEIQENIYLKKEVHFEPLGNALDDLTPPQTLVTLVIGNEDGIDGFITLENTVRPNAFDQRDLNMIGNLKEHLIAAFIKTRLLEDLEHTLNDLKNAQGELIRQEKLASVGQLTKGIVDRILNPLNYVNNFSQSSDDMIDEVIETLQKQPDGVSADVMADLIDDLGILKKNLAKIQEHSNSTTRILKDMQRLLKEKSRDFLETDLNIFVESKTRTLIQELKGEYRDLGVNLVLKLDPQPVRTRLLPYEFGQVVQHIVSNSYYTLFEKSKTVSGFMPEVQIATELENSHVRLRFRDNGKGIPSSELARLFSPFFTTKPTSKGTGLGLFMTKDIVELHKGKIEINSKEGEYTEIVMVLPAQVG